VSIAPCTADPCHPRHPKARGSCTGVEAARSQAAASRQPRSHGGEWIAKQQQLARQGTKCFWREPVGQQKSAQRHTHTLGIIRSASHTARSGHTACAVQLTDLGPADELMSLLMSSKYSSWSSFNSIRKIIQRIGPTEFSSGAGSTAGLQFRRGGNQQGQQADR
jgi:hypothetical protein